MTFARDALKARADASLDEFRIDDLQGWIASGRHAYLAAAIRGTPPRELRTVLDETIETVHLLKGSELIHFDGDAAVFEPLRPELENCLRQQYRKETFAAGKARYTRAYLVLAAVAGLIILAAVLAWSADGRWQDFLHRLAAEPGIAVTSARHAWWGRSHVDGLRDPLAADPAPLAQAAGMNPNSVEYAWKSYLALDTASIRRRFEQRFPLAAGTKFDIRDGGVIDLSGTAPYEWTERVRREGTEVPGVSKVNTGGLKPSFDPALALARFQEAYPLPPKVSAHIEDGGTLALAGTAPYEWLASVRAEATHLPGINAVSEKGLEVAFAPQLVLQRFTERFGLLDTVNASVQGGVLTLAGEASHGWLSRVRVGRFANPRHHVPG